MLPDIQLCDVEASGLWWRPDAPDDRLPGTLRTHESDDAELILFGVWRNPDGSPVQDPDVICGYADRIWWVTLLECGPLLPSQTAAGSRSGVVEVRRTHGSAHVVLAGDSLGPGYVAAFSLMTVVFSHLSQWALPFGPHETLRPEAKRHDEYRDELAVLVPHVRDAVAKVGDTTIKMKTWATTRNAGRLGLTVEPRLDVEVTQPSNVDLLPWWVDTITDLREFFSLLTGVPLRARRVWVCPELAADDHPSCVEVHVPKSTADAFWADRSRHDMLVTHKEVAASFQTLVERWMKRSPELRRACRQFLVARDGTRYAEQRFLSLAQALEVLHVAEHGGGSLMDREEFARIKTALIGITQQVTTGDTMEALNMRIGALRVFLWVV